MAIVSVNESVESREAAWVFENGPKSQYTRTFIVVSDATVTDLNQILQLSGADVGTGVNPGPTYVPQLGDFYESDRGATVNAVRVRQLGDNRLTFLLVVEYGNPPPSGHGHNPSNLDWEFSTESQELERIADIDYGINAANDNGVGEIENSAREPFDPPVMESEHILIINVSKYFDDWDIDTQSQREGYINAGQFTLLGKVMEKHCLLCTRWRTSGKQFIDGGEYFKLEAQFIYRPPREVRSDGETVTVAGWNRAVADVGFRQFINGKLVPIPDGAGGLPTTVPRKLKDGIALPPGPDYDLVYLFFRTKKQANMVQWTLPEQIP